MQHPASHGLGPSLSLVPRPHPELEPETIRGARKWSLLGARPQPSSLSRPEAEGGATIGRWGATVHDSEGARAAAVEHYL